MRETGPVEVVRAARAFNTMQSRLAAHMRERTQVLAAMSHDLKTPITRLRLRAEMLDDELLRAKFTSDLQEMEAMVTAALDFLRGMENSEPVQPVDIMSLLESLQADRQETGGSVQIEGGTAQPYRGRAQALKRCIGNLVENAIKYGRHARIVVEDSHGQLVLRIQDDGPGIPADQLGKVFEPFYRLESSRNRDTGGSGLGLAIARGVAELHGGSVTLANRPQGGLEATLTLPRA
jgi:signal transduction histidine kinase